MIIIVSENGVFKEGKEVTIIANLDDKKGFSFKNWTEDGEIVHTDKSYVFKVNRDRTLVANFEKVQHSIKVFSNPPESGIVIYDGVQEFFYDNSLEYEVITCEHGEKVTLLAAIRAESDYVFKNWTENGKVVHEEREYKFIAEQDRELTINFYVPLQASVFGRPPEFGVGAEIIAIEVGQQIKRMVLNTCFGVKDKYDLAVALSRLPNDIIFFRGHANAELLQFTGESDMESKDIQSADLKGMQLAVLAGCNTAKDVHQNENNILLSFIDSGARVGVGFSDVVPALHLNDWSEIFWDSMINNNLTVHEASLAGTFKKTFAPFRFLLQHGVEEHLPVTYPVEKARKLTIADILEGAER